MGQAWYHVHTFNSDSSVFGGVRSVSINQGREVIACGNDDNTIKLWNLNNGQMLDCPFKHTKAVRSLILTSKGDKIISGGDDGIIRVWDVNKSQELLTLKNHSKSVTAIAIIPIGYRFKPGQWVGREF